MMSPYEYIEMVDSQAFDEDEHWALERQAQEAFDYAIDEGYEEDEPEVDPDAQLEEYHWKLSAGSH